MQRNARPRQALHEGHRRAFIDIALVVFAFFQHRKNAGRRVEPGPAAGNPRLCDLAGSIESSQALLLNGYEDKQGARRVRSVNLRPQRRCASSEDVIVTVAAIATRHADAAVRKDQRLRPLTWTTLSTQHPTRL
jgi:hypothetical protein